MVVSTDRSGRRPGFRCGQLKAKLNATSEADRGVRCVSLTHRPLPQTCARYLPEGIFAMVGISCATRRRTVANRGDMERRNGGLAARLTS